MQEIETIVFSKNRACQLDLFIRSVARCAPGLYNGLKVIYTYTDDTFKAGYDKLITMCPGVKFVFEDDDFKKVLLRTIDWTKPLLSFFTDDDVFLRLVFKDDDPFKIFLTDDSILCLSLQLGKNITRAYERERAIKQPEFDKDNKWTWRSADIDFNYPMSVMGHIFRMEYIRPLLERLNYTKAWNLESELCKNPINKENMICYEESRIVELCNNQVSGVPNKAGNINPTWLNKKFLDGERIVLEYFNHDSVHYEREYKFEVIK